MKPVSYADIEPLELEEIWRGRIPCGTPTYVVGESTVGKGFLFADLISRVTNGDVMPDGSELQTRAGSVITITPEDDPNLAMANRLNAAGANMSKVYDMTEGFMLPDSLPELGAAINSIGDVRMVYMDPLSSLAQRSLSSGAVTIRRTLTCPLERTAATHGIGLAVVLHTVKSGAVQGSQTIVDASRMLLRIKRNENDHKIRLVHVDRTNIANGEDTPDVAYTIVGGEKPNDTHVEYLDVPEEVNEGPSETDNVNRGMTGAAKMLEVLRTAGEPLDCQQLARRAHTTYCNARVAMSRFSRSGEVMSPGRGLWTVPDQRLKDLRETISQAPH